MGEAAPTQEHKSAPIPPRHCWTVLCGKLTEEQRHKRAMYYYMHWHELEHLEREWTREPNGGRSEKGRRTADE